MPSVASCHLPRLTVADAFSPLGDLRGVCPVVSMCLPYVAVYLQTRWK